MLSQIVTWCLGIALFLTLSEIVTELYPSTEHSMGLQYLMFGHNGLSKLVPFFWTALALMVGSFIMLLIPRLRKNMAVLPFICIAAFVGIWVEKGMGLMLPGVIPTPIGEFAEYMPSSIELMVVGGIWAIGFFVLTIMLKGAVGILLGDVVYQDSAANQQTNGKQAEAAAT